MSLLEKIDPVEYKVREIIKKANRLIKYYPEAIINHRNDKFHIIDIAGYLDYEDPLFLFELEEYGLSLKVDDKVIRYEHHENGTIDISLHKVDGKFEKFVDSLDLIDSYGRVTDEDRFEYLEIFDGELDKIKKEFYEKRYPQLKLANFNVS